MKKACLLADKIHCLFSTTAQCKWLPCMVEMLEAGLAKLHDLRQVELFKKWGGPIYELMIQVKKNYNQVWPLKDKNRAANEKHSESSMILA